MRPANLSASSAQTFEYCPAMFKAEYITRGRDASGSAADLGSTCHSALEFLVKRGMMQPKCEWEAVLPVYDEAFDKNGLTDESRHAEGLAMVRRWWERTDLDDGRKILSTEKFERFPLTLPSGLSLPWVYVIDRLDQHADGELEVVDYKTVIQAIQPEELLHKVQARSYAVGVQMMFPEAERVRVTFDLLRHDQISVVFTKENNRDSYRYLQRLGERVLASDGSQETLNENCRYCVRRHECKAMKKHIEVGGPLTITDPAVAAEKRLELGHAEKAIKKMMEDLDTVILTHCEEKDILEFTTEHVRVDIGASSRRVIDPGQAAAIIGPELVAKYGNLTIGAVENLLKGSEIDDEQKSRLKQIVGMKIGNPTIKIKELKK